MDHPRHDLFAYTGFACDENRGPSPSYPADLHQKWLPAWTLADHFDGVANRNRTMLIWRFNRLKFILNCSGIHESISFLLTHVVAPDEFGDLGAIHSRMARRTRNSWDRTAFGDIENFVATSLHGYSKMQTSPTSCC